MELECLHLVEVSKTRRMLLHRITLPLLVALCQYQISKAEAKDLVVKLDTLNVNQVFNLLRNNGATPNEAATLAGISVFEAGGGNPNAINPNAINDNARTQDFS